MCRVFGVSRSRYYAQLKSGATKRQREDQALLVDIKAVFDDSDRTYGAGRIARDLRAQGTRAGKNRIWRLMKQHGLRVKTTKRFRVTTNSDHKRPVAPNLVQRNFSAEAPDRLWTGDITYSAPRLGISRGAYSWNARRKEGLKCLALRCGRA